jgi:hypothetical protein
MKRKHAISLLTTVVVVCIIATGGYAAATLTPISAYLNHGIRITYEGQPLELRDAQGRQLTPITYEGSTYLPVRAVAQAAGIAVDWDAATQTVLLGDQYDVVLEFPADEYPSVAAHIASAILAGESAVCTIDRQGAEQRREKSLAGIPTRDGYDRDEWPMAMCAEGGAGASVAYIDPEENRGAGAWVGNQLEKYPDGTRVKFVVTFGELDADAKRQTSTQPADDGNEIYFRSCAEAKAAGAAPLRSGDPGYGRHLDRDGDGIACE